MEKLYLQFAVAALTLLMMKTVYKPSIKTGIWSASDAQLATLLSPVGISKKMASCSARKTTGASMEKAVRVVMR